MVMCRDAAVAGRLRSLRQHAMDLSAIDRHTTAGFVFERYTELGFNYRMTDLQAAVGLVQLGRLDRMVVRRRDLAEIYRSKLGGQPDLLLPTDPPNGTTNYQSFSVRLRSGGRERRDRILERLSAADIGAKRGIMASHLEEAYATYPHAPLPETEGWTHESLLLPLFHEMTDDEQHRVVEVLIEALKSYRAAPLARWGRSQALSVKSIRRPVAGPGEER